MFGWFKSKEVPKKPANVPSAQHDPQRYAGRPLVLLLENYVLDCIGELEPSKQELMLSIVQKTFGGDQDWKKTLRTQLDLSQNIDEHLRQLWEKNKKIAKENSVELHPVQFSKMITDTNFAPLLNKK